MDEGKGERPLGKPKDPVAEPNYTPEEKAEMDEALAKANKPLAIGDRVRVELDRIEHKNPSGGIPRSNATYPAPATPAKKA